MAQTVVGFFDDASDARKAVTQLTEKGINRGNIDIRENSTDTRVSNDYNNDRSYDNDRDRDHESGIGHFFKSLFGDDDDEADRYSKVASNSRSIVTVQAQSREEAERAADILDEYGAIDVDERSAQYNKTGTGTGYAATEDRDYSTREGRNDREETVIPRVEENLQVRKRVEERGGVRVRSRIVERPVEEHLRLREEHVNVERKAVNRPVTAEDERLFQDREIELTERTEVPVVNKEARVVEEIRLSKEVNERQETVRDTVRKTEVDVDKIDEGRTRDRDRDDLRTDRNL